MEQGAQYANGRESRELLAVEMDLCFCLLGEVPGVLQINQKILKSAFIYDNWDLKDRIAFFPPPCTSILSQSHWG